MKRFLIFCLLIILFEPGFSLDRKSYLQLSFENSERQISEFSCGFAAVTTVLRTFFEINISQEKLMEEYGNDLLKEHRGISFLDMKKISELYNLTAIGFSVNFSAFEEFVTYSKVPVIVHEMKDKKDINSGHFIIVLGEKENYFYILDPTYGEQYVSKSSLKKTMTGNILLILPPDSSPDKDTLVSYSHKKMQEILNNNKMEKMNFYESYY